MGIGSDIQVYLQYDNGGRNVKNDKRGFREVIHSIKNSEKDKDRFLKAARLERHERRPRFSFSSDDLMMVLAFATVWLLLILMFLGTR